MNKPALYFTFDDMANIKAVLSPELQQENGLVQGTVLKNIMEAAGKLYFGYGTEKMRFHKKLLEDSMLSHKRKPKHRRVNYEAIKKGQSKLPYSGEAQTGDDLEHDHVSGHEHTEILVTHIRIEGSGVSG